MEKHTRFRKAITKKRKVEETGIGIGRAEEENACKEKEVAM